MAGCLLKLQTALTRLSQLFLKLLKLAPVILVSFFRCLGLVLDRKHLLLQLENHTVFRGLQMFYFLNIFLSNLRCSFVHLKPVLVHLLKLALEQLNLPRQVFYLVFVGGDLVAVARL